MVYAFLAIVNPSVRINTLALSIYQFRKSIGVAISFLIIIHAI
jgi:hypothetical protein